MTISDEQRKRGLLWALKFFREAADRYPDLAAVVARASGPEQLLDRFILEVDAEATTKRQEEAWKSEVLPRLFTAWFEDAGSNALKMRSATATALDDRRNKIARAAERLSGLLRRNEAKVIAEIEVGLRALPVSVRFPGLLPALDDLVAWADRDASMIEPAQSGTRSARFTRTVIDVLGFRPSWSCLADLWNLFANDQANEMTDDKMRIAWVRSEQPERTNRG